MRQTHNRTAHYYTKQQPTPSSYPPSPNFCPEAVVDCVGKPWISTQLPIHVAISQHCEEPGCSFQKLAGRSLIGYQVALLNVLTYRFSWHDQSSPPCISSGAVGMTMVRTVTCRPQVDLLCCLYSSSHHLVLFVISSGLPLVREIQGQRKVREFYELGKFGILLKVREI